MRRVLFALVVVTLGATLLAGCRAEQEIRRAAAFVATAVAPTPAPVPPFDELLRERAAGCSLAGRDAFVAQAERINNAFEDSYLLALSSPRLALTPVVRDMQFFAREMEELAADPCGVIVRDHLAAAYDQAVRVLLAFMRDEEPDSAPEVFWDLLYSTWLLEAYKRGPGHVLYADPRLGFSSHPHDTASVLDIHRLWITQVFKDHTICTRTLPYQDAFFASLGNAWGRFTVDDVGEPPAYLWVRVDCDEFFGASAVSTPSPTTPPATSPSTVPVAGAPVWLELSITADTATKVQVVRYHSSTGEVLDLGAVSTPFTKMVQGRPGREIELTGVLAAGDERVFCQIVIGERILVRDDGADGRLACRTVIPE